MDSVSIAVRSKKAQMWPEYNNQYGRHADHVMCLWNFVSRMQNIWILPFENPFNWCKQWMLGSSDNCCENGVFKLTLTITSSKLKTLANWNRLIWINLSMKRFVNFVDNNASLDLIVCCDFQSKSQLETLQTRKRNEWSKVVFDIRQITRKVIAKLEMHMALIRPERKKQHRKTNKIARKKNRTNLKKRP